MSDKTKCSICGLAMNFKIFCAEGKKIKHRRVGNDCRLTRCPFVVLFLCPVIPVKMVYFFSYFCSLLSVVSLAFTLAHNLDIYATF